MPDEQGWVDNGDGTWFNVYDGGTYDGDGNLLPSGATYDPYSGFGGGYDPYAGYGGGDPYSGYSGYAGYDPWNSGGSTIDPSTPMGGFLTGATGGGSPAPSYYDPWAYGSGYNVGGTMGSGSGAYTGGGDPYYNAGASVGGTMGTGATGGGYTPGVQNPYGTGTTSGGYNAGYGMGATAGQPYGPGGGAGSGGAGGAAPINNYVNVQNPGGDAGAGGMSAQDMYAYINGQLAAAQIAADASKYGSDNTKAVGMANVDLGYTQAANDLQARMAAVNAQLASVDAQLQNAQLDATTRMSLEQMRNDLGYYQADLQNQIAQAQQAYQYLALAQQGQLGMGALNIQGMDADTRRMLGLGQLDVQQGQLGLSALTGLGQLDLQRMLGVANIQNQQGQLGLQTYLGMNQAQLAQSQQALDAMLGFGGQDIQRFTAMANAQNQQGQLGLGYGNLNLDTQRFGFTQQEANRQAAERQAQFAASLRGPRDAFAQQAYLHGLNQNGLSNAVGSIRGEFNQPRTEGLHAPVEPVTPETFQQDTGITLPGAITAPAAA